MVKEFGYWLLPLVIVGVEMFGDVPKTNSPVPVSFVTAVARLALFGVAKNVATPVPNPVIPVDTGRPVPLVNVTALGTPKFGVVKVGEVDITTLPVPVIALETTFLLASVNKACDAVVVDKIGAAENVLTPAMVCASVVTRPLALEEAFGIFSVIVPLDVIGLPEIFTSFPVFPVVSPIEVTVPVELEDPAPIAARKSAADKAETVLLALN